MKITKSEPLKPEDTLFPDKFLDIRELRNSSNINIIRNQFKNLLKNKNSNERSILNFINKNEYWLIIGLLQKNLSINYYGAGHHATYVFKEFRLGSTHIADYLIIGKGSGGYQFVFVELEAPYKRGNKRVTSKTGDLGGVFTDGIKQVKNWKYWLDQDYSSLHTSSFSNYKNENMDLPEEFYKYDSSRMHFIVIAGRREDFHKKTYLEQRNSIKNNPPIQLLHYDNVIDNLSKTHRNY